MYRYLLFDNIVLTFFQVIRSVHSLMTRLMSQFPTEPTSSSVASKHEELDQLYAAVAKVVQTPETFNFLTLEQLYPRHIPSHPLSLHLTGHTCSTVPYRHLCLLVLLGEKRLLQIPSLYI